jgi:translation initiation factor IF-1
LSTELKQRETAIWNLGLLGREVFFVDLWDVSSENGHEPVGYIPRKRIVACDVIIVKMIFNNKNKTRVDHCEITDISHEDINQKQQLRLKTEDGEIVVKAFSIFEIKNYPVPSGPPIF